MKATEVKQGKIARLSIGPVEATGDVQGGAGAGALKMRNA
jgi:hypothetical protein